jgi:hypothetical protein
MGDMTPASVSPHSHTPHAPIGIKLTQARVDLFQHPRPGAQCRRSQRVQRLLHRTQRRVQVLRFSRHIQQAGGHLALRLQGLDMGHGRDAVGGVVALVQLAQAHE